MDQPNPNSAARPGQNGDDGNGRPVAERHHAPAAEPLHPVDPSGWSLSDLSIRNPVFAVMLSAAMVVFGYLGYRDMGVSQFPEIDFPVVSVAITLENAPPETIDADVTDKVEDAIAGVEGVDYIMSQSLQGLSIVTVYFRLSRNIDVAMQEVQNAVSGARRKLPLEIDPPVISKINPNNLPVLWLTLSSDTQPINLLSDFAEKWHVRWQQTFRRPIDVSRYGGLGIRYVVLRKEHRLNRPPEYENARYVVYPAP